MMDDFRISQEKKWANKVLINVHVAKIHSSLNNLLLLINPLCINNYLGYYKYLI